MRILFFMSHPGHARNFETTLREAAERGHEVIVAIDRDDKPTLPDVLEPLETLAVECTNLEYLSTPLTRKGDWSDVGVRLRSSLDYLHHLEPTIDQAPRVRDRAGTRIPDSLSGAARAPILRTSAGRELLRGVLELADEGAPVPGSIRRFLREIDPDVVLITPLVELGSPQLIYVRAAKELGVASALLLASWDNLTMKGVIHGPPDRVLVWNEAQLKEAVELHRVPPDRVLVTGAPAFDHWIGWEPTEPREDFLRRIGLDPSRPYLLYTASSEFVAGDEMPFVLEWVRGLRRADHRGVRDAQVLVRPHPANPRSSSSPARDEIAAMDGVVVHPAGGQNPVDGRSRDEYYSSLTWSAGVVGLLTSALLEATIAGRPTHTVLSPRYADSHARLLHFRHLSREFGGPLHVARSFPEHAEQLVASLTNSASDGGARRDFVDAFVWPRGKRHPVAPVVVDAIEELGRVSVAARRRRPLAGRALAAGGRAYLEYRRSRARRAKRRERERSEHRDGRLAQWGDRASVAAKSRGLAERKSAPSKVKSKSAKGKVRAPAAAAGRHPDQRVDASERGLLPPGVAVPSPAEVERAAGSELALLRAEVARLAERGNPVIVGPFLAEVGFELLYWLPLVRWAVAEHPELEKRLVVVSRGGTRSWLDGIDVRYVDVLQLYEPHEFVRRRMSLKQRELSEFEHEILRRVKEIAGISRADVLHPALFFNTYFRLMKRQRFAYAGAVRQENGRSVGLAAMFAPLGAPDRDLVAERLPDSYVAVRFYSRESFPETKANRLFATSAMASLARELPIVLLNNRMELDEHVDFSSVPASSVITVDDLMTPANNLQVQTAIVASARATVTTYGGLTYLAPFLGRASIGLYSDPTGIHPWHHHLAERVFAAPKFGRLRTLSTTKTDPASVLVEVLRAQVGSGNG